MGPKSLSACFGTIEGQRPIQSATCEKYQLWQQPSDPLKCGVAHRSTEYKGLYMRSKQFVTPISPVITGNLTAFSQFASSFKSVLTNGCLDFDSQFPWNRFDANITWQIEHDLFMLLLGQVTQLSPPIAIHILKGPATVLPGPGK